jgi:serine/threonine protein kinase
MNAGEVIGERYRLDRALGEGGMGAVWAATHVVTQKRVAIKVLRSELASNASLVQRFLREARAICAVRHPNVVQVHDVFQLPSGVPVMVMDLLEGETLAERLARDGKLGVQELARLMLPVLGAVSAAHAASIVHRDLKPDNLFLTPMGDGNVDIKVLDFGIAKASKIDEEIGALTKTGSMLGTPYYMSPEQLYGEKDIDARADVWALGIIFYECLIGRKPTEADNLGQIMKIVTVQGIPPIETVAPNAPPALCALIARMLQADRSKRLSNLDEARQTLTQLARSAAISVGAMPLTPRSDRPVQTADLHWAATQPEGPAPPRGGRIAVFASVGALLVVGSIGGAAFVFRHRDATPNAGLVAPPSVASEVAPPASSVAPAASVPAPPASSVADAGFVRPAVKIDPKRPTPPTAPSASASARPVTTSTANPVLVDKPPF